LIIRLLGDKSKREESVLEYKGFRMKRLIETDEWRALELHAKTIEPYTVHAFYSEGE
tara:strand:- start:146 stop:316 length:171 start_codon:yes stop_codon:yes gene_type:complete